MISGKKTWNKNKLVGQKIPFRPQEIWAIRTRLQIQEKKRDIVLLNLGIDSKLRGCDILGLRVSDLVSADEIKHLAKLVQSKTGKSVQFEITEPTRKALKEWIEFKRLQYHEWVFSSRQDRSNHLTTRLYARVVKSWVQSIGLPKHKYGSIR